MIYTINHAVYAMLISFAACVIMCRFFIPYLAKLKFGQYVRDDGPQSHLSKAGTPTMGGLIIVAAFIISALFFLRGNPHGIALIAVTAGFTAIGFCDDYIKSTKRRSLGLRAYQKWMGQLIVTVLFVVYYMNTPGFTHNILIPFVPNLYLNLGFWYAPFICFAILGAVNGANFTDGLDGLNAGVTLIIAGFFMFVTWMQGSYVLPFTGAIAGALLGFLIYNSYPARIFMGDSGSLPLGGFVAVTAVLLGMPVWLIIVAFIYVAEVASVIIQVLYFKATKGKRFFKMAPIHHSFELSGWSETRICALFYAVTIILCLIGLTAL